MYRTHHCGELKIDNTGTEVTLSGWLNSIRDMGSLIFLTLRDFYGITQAVISDEKMKEFVRSIPRESTITVKGLVCKRSAPNMNIPTGEIEIQPATINIISKCTESLPFEIANSNDSREDTRLKYRFLDLRNPVNKDKIVLRSNIIKSLRDIMTGKGFYEIQTPILTSSSPEGARDYLVPSRVHPGEFYALPQAPQQFKQLLMASGFDKYFQIAPCFRDEDARADRSPGEFYQLDMEMSFATQEDVFAVMEDVLYSVFSQYSDWKIVPPPFTRITYADAIENYGTDKPDIRNPLVIKDVTSIIEASSIAFLQGKTVKAIKLAHCNEPRSFFDKLSDFSRENEGNNIAWLKINNGNVAGSISKQINENDLSALNDILDIQEDAAILFIFDDNKAKAAKMAGIIRNHAGAVLNLFNKNTYEFCWIIDFPMYELDEETGKIEFSHNPFSMPQGGMESLCNMNPLDIKAFQYDIICNGIELSSGAVRNHDPEIMIKAFAIAGYDENVIIAKFPALYNAFKYGAPPHAGIAPGVDRLVMLLADEPNIREVIAFPMNKSAQDLMMNAPNSVLPQQLKDVHIEIKD